MPVFDASVLNPKIREMQTYYDPESGCQVYNDRQAFESCKQTYYLKIQTEQNKEYNNPIDNYEVETPHQNLEDINYELLSIKKEINDIKTDTYNKGSDYLNLTYFFAGILLVLIVFIFIKLFRKYKVRKKDHLIDKIIKKQEKKWWQLKYMSKNDYGKIAIIGLVLAFIKTGIPVPLNPLLNFLVNVIITFGLFAGIMWIIEKSKRNKKE